jgi:hypothetical protein
LAARVSKYGVSLYHAMWEMPLATLNQLLIYDELVAGRTPRWANGSEQCAKDIDALLADALTPGP